MLPLYQRWEKRESAKADALALSRETGYDVNFCRLLNARGVRSASEAARFLEGDLSGLYDPFLMKDMDRAVDRILRAVRSGEKITIYGDYDVDGITATSILLLYFKSIGVSADYYLPDRLTEGYGLNADAVRTIADRGTHLIISVDTGITAEKECELIYELGMEIVVTDHHECLDHLPRAEAVVDARQPGETAPFRLLAGCGVAYKLAWALSMRLGYDFDRAPYIELAAIGTVADVVPLLDENRLIVREGLKLLANPRGLGIKALMTAAGLKADRPLKADHIGFTLAPRLNAGGRMGDASRGVRLFTTTDPEEAERIAAALNEENESRKAMEQEILDQVTAAIEGDPEIKNSRIIVTAGKGWHHGVIGIVSSRIKDMYYRPNIILSVEDGIAKGSARSIDGFNLFEALKSCADLMIRFGGHAAAAGMTLKEEDVPELFRRLNAYAKDHMPTGLMVPVLHPELVVSPEEVTTSFIENLEKMAPFGQEMPEPVIAVEGTLSEVSAIGQDRQTLRMKMGAGRGGLTFIGFKKASFRDFYYPSEKVTVVGAGNLNHYGGQVYPQLYIQDVHGQMSEDVERLLILFGLRHTAGDFLDACEGNAPVPKEVCREVYLYLRNLARRSPSGNQALFRLDRAKLTCLSKAGEEARTRAFLLGLAVFEELGLLDISQSGPYFDCRLIGGKKMLLADSVVFRRFFEG